MQMLSSSQESCYRGLNTEPHDFVGSANFLKSSRMVSLLQESLPKELRFDTLSVGGISVLTGVPPTDSVSKESIYARSRQTDYSGWSGGSASHSYFR